MGCKVYILEGYTTKFVTDLRGKENVVYWDRYDIAVEVDVLASLEFSNEDESIDDEQESLGSDQTGDDTPGH